MFLTAFAHTQRLPFLRSFFFNAPATTEIYTLSLHDALPISNHLLAGQPGQLDLDEALDLCLRELRQMVGDRKSTRLNSSHSQISYAVFCLKKKKGHTPTTRAEERYGT